DSWTSCEPPEGEVSRLLTSRRDSWLHCPTQTGILTQGFGRTCFKSGREDLNLRPHGPGPSSVETQVNTQQSVPHPSPGVCTPVCTSDPKPEQPDPVAALAAALVGLSPSDRARLAALLVGQQPGQPEAKS